MEYKRLINDESLLKDIRQQAEKASKEFLKESGPYSGQIFDDSTIERFENADPGVLETIKDLVKKYQQTYMTNFEMHCICELAIHYIDDVLRNRDIGYEKFQEGYLKGLEERK